MPAGDFLRCHKCHAEALPFFASMNSREVWANNAQTVEHNCSLYTRL